MQLNGCLADFCTFVTFQVILTVSRINAVIEVTCVILTLHSPALLEEILRNEDEPQLSKYKEVFNMIHFKLLCLSQTKRKYRK